MLELTAWLSVPTEILLVPIPAIDVVAPDAVGNELFFPTDELLLFGGTLLLGTVCRFVGIGLKDSGAFVDL